MDCKCKAYRPFIVTIDPESAAPVYVSPQGEHNAVMLEILLPLRFQGVTVGGISCSVNGEPVYMGVVGTDQAEPVYFARRKCYLLLWKQLTAGVLRVQVTGRTQGGAVVKTEISPDILFSKSLPDDIFIDAPLGLLDLLHNAVGDSHKHHDMALLDAFSEQDGRLLWQGIPLVHSLATDEDIDQIFNNQEEDDNGD